MIAAGDGGRRIREHVATAVYVHLMFVAKRAPASTSRAPPNANG